MSTTRPRRTKRTQEEKPKFEPLNDEQFNYLEAIDENDVIIAMGQAGTGKTCCAAAKAAEYLLDNRVHKIIVTRSSAQDDQLGFLPGDEIEKISPALNGILAELSEFINVKKEINDGRLEITSLAYLKSRTFKNSFVILEEAQNCTYSQLKMFITRLGNNTKMILSGDVAQSSLHYSVANDFSKFINQMDRIAIPENKIEIIELIKSVRHPLIDIILGVLD